MNSLRLMGPVRRSLTRHKLRSLLTMISVTVGIAALTIVSSIGEGTKDEMLHRFKNMLGTFDTLIIRPGGANNRGMVSVSNVGASLSFDDAAAIASSPSIRQVAQLLNSLDVDVKYRNRSESAGVFGVTPNWATLRGDDLAEGDFIDTAAMASLARVAVIGADVQAKLFPNEDPLGKTIRIGGVPFLVKGVLTARGAGPSGASLDNVIMVPVTTASKRLFNSDFLTMAVAQLKDPSASDAAIAEVTALLRRRHHLPRGVADDFSVTSPRAVMAQIVSMGSAFQTLLSLVAVAAILIGGVVIMVVTLIGVSSRRAEIGLERAVGAPRNAILTQFLAEAVLISACGGLLGVLIGVGGTQAVSYYQKLPFLIDLPTVAVSVGVSIAVGLVFGVYPAVRASRTDPIKALRA